MKIVINNADIVIQDADDKLIEALNKRLSYKDKSVEFQVRRMESNPYQRNSPYLDKLKKQMYGSLLKKVNDNEYVIPSGFSGLLDKLNYEDNRCETGETISLAWNNKPFDPRPYQEEALEIMETSWRGTINFATGLGKTLTAVHAIRKFKKKSLIVCPGVSIADNFYEELCEAFGEHRVGYFGNSKKKIRDITVAIAGSVNNHIDKFKKADLGLVIFDECFPYRQNLVTDMGPMEIGKLVRMWENDEKLPLIKSFNEASGRFEFKKMTYGWRKQREDLVEIKISKRKIKCTPEHKILTTKGWKKASELKAGELVVGNYDLSKEEQHIVPSLNSDQVQALIGSFLGDGCVTNISKNRFRLKVLHGDRQSAYCEWKASIFNVPTRTVSNNGYSKKAAVSFTSKSFDIDVDIPSKKDTCPQWILDNIGPLGLAIWFMDDGSTSKLLNSARIATCSFDEESQDRIVGCFKRFGIDCEKRFVKYSGRRYPGYWEIFFKKEGFKKLIKIIEPFIHPSMSYKIGKKTCNIPKVNTEFLDYGTVPVTHVKNIKNKTLKNRKPYVFDIEVEDNHNFIVCSPAGEAGVVAHNCHHIAASTFINIANGLADIGRMYGLTATNFRSDGKDVMIEAGVGPNIIKRDLIWGIKNGWLADPYIVVREVPTIGKDIPNDKIKNYKAHILKDETITRRIISDAQKMMAAGKSTLILVKEIEHGKMISEKLGLPLATGTDKQSKQYIKQLNCELIPGLVGTAQFIGEGTDTKNVDCLILVNFTASKGPLWQNLGRGLRIYNGRNKLIVLDYIPLGSKMLTRHAKQRIKYYEEITSNIRIC